MESNRNNDNNPNKKPGDGQRPKGNIGTALLITLVIVLLFSWIFNSVEKSQYTETTFSDFLDAKKAGQLAEVELQYDRILYMTKAEAAKAAKAAAASAPENG